MATPENSQLHPVLFKIGTSRHLVVVMIFDRAGSDFTVTRDGNHNGAPNYTVSYTCGTGSATPTVVSRSQNVTADLGNGETLYLNQSLPVLLEQVPDNWKKCTP